MFIEFIEFLLSKKKNMPFVEAKILHECSSIGRIGFYDVQLNPGNSNCQGKLKLLGVIGVSSYTG